MPGGVAELCLAVADHGSRMPHKKQKRRRHRHSKPGKGHDTGVPDAAETEPDIPQLRPETDAEPDPGKALSPAEVGLSHITSDSNQHIGICVLHRCS